MCMSFYVTASVSEAIQEAFSFHESYGSPRRCASRDDGEGCYREDGSPHVATFLTKKHYCVSVKEERGGDFVK